MKARIGLITTMSPDATWPESIVAKVIDDHRKARVALSGLDFEVIAPSDGLSRTKEEMLRDARKLREENVQTVVVYVGTWTYSNITVKLSGIVNVPILVWTNSGPGNVGLVGAAIARGALDEIGFPTTLIHGGFDDPGTLEKVRQWCVGAAAAVRLRGTTLGIGGSRCMGMYTAQVDPSDVKKRFGVDIDGYDEMDVVERSRRIPDERAERFFQWMRETFGEITAREKVVRAQIKMYLALKALIKEKGYDFIAVKCLPSMPSLHTTFCLAIAMLNDQSDDEGSKDSIICGCEADANGALTMQMMHNVSGTTVLFADFLRYEAEKNLVTLCNCGSQPTDLAVNRKEVRWVTEGLVEFKWLMGGMCPQYVAKPGRVTLARLGRIGGEYVMLLMGGEAKTYPREKLAEVSPQHPQAFVQLDCSPDNFFAELRCNHVHMVYGDYRKELAVLCQVLGIRPICP